MIRLQQTGYSLGADIYLTLIVKNKKPAGSIFKELWAAIHNFDNAYSRFKLSSELTKLNSHDGERFKVSSELADMFKASQELNTDTHGLFNPLVLPALQKSGYKGSWPEVDKISLKLDYSKRSSAAFSKVIIERDALTLPKNSAYDSGGIGKGYLLDKLYAYLISKNVNDFWLSLGGDIICSGHDLNKNWRVGVARADQKSSNLFIENKDGEKLAIATSGITKRRGSDWHHIIDPRTNLPAKTDVAVATITNKSATKADVYAKCLVILGSKDSKSFIKDHSINFAVLQYYRSDKLQVLTLKEA